MSFKYLNVAVGVATALCLSSTAFASGPGEEETAEESPAPVAAAAEPAAPEEEGFLGDWIPGTFSGTVATFSDYSFRGVSQTQTGFAGQLGVTWKQDCGFYIAAWGSNLHYGSGDDANWEQDIVAGFTNSIGIFTYDVSGTALIYPKASKYTYFEIAAKGAFNVMDVATVKIGALYSPDYFGILNNAGYFSTGVAVPLPIPKNNFVTLTVDANLGYTISDQYIFTTDSRGGTRNDNNYMDWNVGLGIGVHKNLTLDLRYVDTDLSIGSIGDQRFIGGATFSF